jgi:hypothetical protein
VLKAREHGGFINSEALKLIREEEQIRGPLPKSSFYVQILKKRSE